MVIEVRLGNQNPTQSVILPFTKSRYKTAIEAYEKSGRTAQEWQVELAKDLFAVNDDGLWFIRSLVTQFHEGMVKPN